jgi:hypothetical protein
MQWNFEGENKDPDSQEFQKWVKNQLPDLCNNGSQEVVKLYRRRLSIVIMYSQIWLNILMERMTTNLATSQFSIKKH